MICPNIGNLKRAIDNLIFNLWLRKFNFIKIKSAPNMLKVLSKIYGNISDRERRIEVIIGNDTFDEINSSATCGNTRLSNA